MKSSKSLTLKTLELSGIFQDSKETLKFSVDLRSKLSSFHKSQEIYKSLK